MEGSFKFFIVALTIHCTCFVVLSIDTSYEAVDSHKHLCTDVGLKPQSFDYSEVTCEGGYVIRKPKNEILYYEKE